jgi:hypothetical protein
MHRRFWRWNRVLDKMTILIRLRGRKHYNTHNLVYVRGEIRKSQNQRKGAEKGKVVDILLLP